ncbi:cytochrome P460 family protein [Kiloniella antarctica]|uniref:Cytochrome P460 family protein n=1 Tax=Kiloniella antarctica TaxID=1550907 RepID=A0ABW5BQY4_9PROT
MITQLTSTLKALALSAAVAPVLFMVPAIATAEEISDEKAVEHYEEISPKLRAGYAKSEHPVSTEYFNWDRYTVGPHKSSTHGGRFVHNYANDLAKAYGKYEDIGILPVGAIVAKDSFKVTKKGVKPGPLFLMEKMEAGFSPEDGNWKYTLITPNGKIFGETNGVNSKKVKFCADCHNAVGEDQDYLFFPEEDYRVQN